jgi:hypothetical protein
MGNVCAGGKEILWSKSLGIYVYYLIVDTVPSSVTD